MMLKQTAFIGGLVLALGCQRSKVGAKTYPVVRVETVSPAPAAAGNRYAASVLAAAKVDVAFRLGGYVDMIARVKGEDGKARLIQEGDPVTTGLVLAQLRQSDVQQKLAEAKANLAEVRASREQAQLDMGRTSKLLASKTVAQAEADAARIKLEVARAHVAAAEARLAEATTAVSDATLRSPIDGILLQRSVEIGTLAAPGAPAFVVADTQSVKVVLGVPDMVLDRLTVGSDQAVTTEAYPDRTFYGKTTRLSPYADPKSRVFEVEISIPNPDHALKIGMVVALSLGPTATSAKALLPLDAVLRSPRAKDGFAVLVVDDHAAPPVAHLRDVKLGDFLGNMIPVVSGLEPTEKVIVQGAAYVSDGEQVRILEEGRDAGGSL